MWKKLVRPLRAALAGCGEGRIWFDEEGPRCDGPVIVAALGSAPPRPGRAGAMLADTTSVERLGDVVRFCAARRLPVGAWQLTGLWEVPARVDETAGFVHRLACEAGEALVWVDTRGMPARYRRRLAAYLRRHGWRLGGEVDGYTDA